MVYVGCMIGTLYGGCMSDTRLVQYSTTGVPAAVDTRFQPSCESSDMWPFNYTPGAEKSKKEPVLWISQPARP